jgi:hypothetical protein
MVPACRWINAIHGSTDGKGPGEVQVGDATPRSGRLSKLMQSDREDSSAPRTEIVTVDTLTNKVNGLRCWSCLVLVLVLHPPPPPPRYSHKPLHSPMPHHLCPRFLVPLRRAPQVRGKLAAAAPKQPSAQASPARRKSASGFSFRELMTYFKK